MLLVAPHCDDAALSCAGLLARSEPIDILTVFAGTPDSPWPSDWDLTTGFADPAESVLARRAEEEAAIADTPHRLAFLELLDAAYLGAPRSQDAARAINAAIRSWLEKNRDGVVAAPAGAGRRPGRIATRARRVMRVDLPPRHPDHVAVRDAALEVIGATSGRGLLYEEVPYLWGKSAEAEVRRIARRGRFFAETVDVPVDRATKARRIAVYASQAPHLRVGTRRPDSPQDLPAIERYWFLSAAPPRVPGNGSR